MRDSEFTCDRRTALKGIAGVGLAATSSVTGAASATAPGEFVATDVAATAADRMMSYYGSVRPEHAHWTDATPGSPTTYYMIAGDGSYEPAAHVFPVETDGGANTVGHIAISARRSWPPVLEYSNASPPSDNSAEAIRAARSMGVEPTGRLLYQGALNFGIQVSDTEMVHLGSRQLGPVRATSELLAHDVTDTVDAERQWQLVTDPGFEPTAEFGTYAGTHLDFDQYAWDGHYAEGPAQGLPDGDGSGGSDYPANRGMADDSWDAWDGCSPIAATQIVMYHENLWNYSWNVEEREKICDAFHHLMHTNDAGWSKTWNVDNGFDEIAGELDFLENSYNGTNEYNLSKSLVRSEIDAGEPFMLTNYNVPIIGSYDGDAGTRKKKGDNYNGHSVVGSGYENGSPMEIDVWEGWNTNRHTLTYGSWDATTMITRVTPQ